MKEDKQLADKYIELLDAWEKAGLPTWDDFFDHVGIFKEHRSDFACTAILKQVMERKQR